MRNILLSLLCSLFIVGCAQAPQEMVLTFKVSNPTAKEVVVVCHNDVRMFPIDETGTAVAALKGMDAVYAKVWYGRENRKVFMEKGDNAVISFDGEDFGGTFAFDGEKKAAVEYLNKVAMTSLEDDAYALPFDTYIEKLNAKRDNALKVMKASDVKSCGGFMKMEEGRIRYAYAAPLLMYPVGHMLMSQNPEYTPDEAYYSAVESYFVENSRYADLDEYRNFITEAAHVLDKVNRDEKNVRLKTAAQMQYITDKFTDTKVVSALLHTLAETYVEMFGVEGTEEIQTLHSTYVKDPAMIAAFAEKVDKHDLSKPGRKSPDFEAVDINGKVWTLADFKGKYLYIDMWATWCGPCKRELPYLKALAEKFADAELTILGISIDESKDKWEEMVREGGMPGIQVHVGPRSKFQKAYKINSIPRFILIGKDSKIINNDMLRPSSEDIASYLEGLEGIRK